MEPLLRWFTVLVLAGGLITTGQGHVCVRGIELLWTTVVSSRHLFFYYVVYLSFRESFFCPLNRLRYRWLAVGASYMWLSMVSDVRHCLSSRTSTMSSGHNLLDIPPIFIACCRDTPAYEDSTDGVQVPEVDNKPLLPPASPTPTVKI